MSIAFIQTATVANATTTATTTDIPAHGYFPTRPAGVALEKMSGQLIGYGVGNKSGGVTLRLKDGKIVNFFLAFPNRIDGKRYDCDIPPYDGQSPSPSLCKQWPHSIVLGRTCVRVTYWWADLRGQRVRVSDTLVTISRR